MYRQSRLLTLSIFLVISFVRPAPLDGKRLEISLAARTVDPAPAALVADDHPCVVTSTVTVTATASDAAPTAQPSSASRWTMPTSLPTDPTELASVLGAQRWTWGEKNVKVLPAVPADAKASPYSSDETGSDTQDSNAQPDPNNGDVMRIRFPKGSINPGNDEAPQGGIGLYASPLDVSDARNISLSYSVFFPADFDFVKGGKLPGLYGGKTGCSGGSNADNCFSTRLMWRKGGLGELYLYGPRRKQGPSVCSLPPSSLCSGPYGLSLGRGSWTFARGAWTDVRQDIWLNTDGVADGGFNVWVDGKLVLHAEDVYYRHVAPSSTLVKGAAQRELPLATPIESVPYSPFVPLGYPQPGGIEARIGVAKTILMVAPTSTPKPLPAAPRARRGVGRKTAKKPVGFLGIMADFFFGGHDPTWASPRTQYLYWNRVALQINDQAMASPREGNVILPKARVLRRRTASKFA